MNYYIDQKSCESKPSFQWIYPKRTYSDCMSYGFGCPTKQTEITGLLASNYTDPSIVTNDITTARKRCGLNAQSLFGWTNATWMDGQLGVTNWVERNMVQMNRNTSTLNFTKLQSYVTLTSNAQLLYSRQNLVFCFVLFWFVSLIF